MKLARAVALAWLAAAAACGEETVTVRPALDAPPAGSDADPFAGIEELAFAIARAGDEADLALATVAADEPLRLADVPFGDDLVFHLSGRASGVEISYGRTCAIDVPVDARPRVPEPRLYLSRIVKWGQAPAPLEPVRAGGGVYAAPDGRAVFVGGAGVSSVEAFDPVEAGAFEPVNATPVTRTGAVLTPLADGRALIVGGSDAGGEAVATVEVLDPTAGAVTPVSALDGPALEAHAAAALVDGSVLVTGGRPPGAGGALDEAWLFQLGDGGALDPPAALVPRLVAARAGHTMTRLGDEVGADVLLVGGLGEDGQPVAQAELYRPLRELFEPVDGAVLLQPRYAHHAVRLPGGFVLIVGGLAPDPVGGPPVPVAALELYDPIQGRFSNAGALPASAGVTELTVTPLPDGRVLLAGGRDRDGAPVAATFIARLDPIDGRVDVVATDAMSTPRAGHNAVLLCDGTVLVVGGSDTGGAERYAPPSVGRR